MKRVCVLLPCSIARDSRAQRTIRTMARHAEVDVWHRPEGAGEDAIALPAGARVRVQPLLREPCRRDWLLRHSFIHLETSWMADAVAASGGRYDLVYAHDLPTSHPALRLARLQAAKIVYDVHDLFVETIPQGFPEDAPPLRKLRHRLARAVMQASAARWERRFVQQADLVVTTTKSYLGYLRERYGLRDGLVLPNYPELRDVPHSDRLYEALRIPRSQAIVLYHGVLGRGRSLELIVRSAAHLADGNCLVLVGDGHLEKDLKALAAGPESRGKVHFHPAVPYAELLTLASAAALGLILIDPINLSKRYALANKLTEYMASGVAVAATDMPENRRILEASGAGILVDESTPETLGARLNALLADREALRRQGEAGRRAFRERFHWEVFEPLFEREFLRLLEAA